MKERERRLGRPSQYTEAMADAICDEIAKGGLITHICAQLGFPDYKTFRKWRSEHPDFSERIAHARKDQATVYHDEMVELNKSMNAENWQFVNARIRNTQWLLGKLDAASYGDKVQNEITGADGGPVKAEITVKFVKPNA